MRHRILLVLLLIYVPKQTYRYTTPVDVNGDHCDLAGWVVQHGDLAAQGTNSDGSVWADVTWDNYPSGLISNVCGALNVTIKSIAQPTMNESPKIIICGTGSVTLHATVSSTTNITGYIWRITGTGITETGTLYTSTPQITLHYFKWIVGSSYSAQVAVGTQNSCGYSTQVTPINSPEPIIPSIARNVWVQLSVGNIDDLMVPFSISPTSICSTGTMVVANQPAGSTLSWTSGNTAALTVDPVTGFATRINNSTTGVTIFATVSNDCGSYTRTMPVAVGTGITDVLFEQKTVACVQSGNNAYTILGRVTASPDINAVYKWYIGPAARTNFVLKATSSGNSATVPGDQADNLYHTLRVIITNPCGIVQTSDVEGRFKASCSGGGGGSFTRIYPNPASNQLSVSLASTPSSESSFKSAADNESDIDQTSNFEAKLFDSFEQVVRSGTSHKGQADFNIADLKNGVYYLHLIVGDKVIRERVQISK